MKKYIWARNAEAKCRHSRRMEGTVQVTNAGAGGGEIGNIGGTTGSKIQRQSHTERKAIP